MNLLDRIIHFFSKSEGAPIKPRRRVAKHKRHNYLTPDQVDAIKHLLIKDTDTDTIVSTFNISRATISRIRTSKHPHA